MASRPPVRSSTVGYRPTSIPYPHPHLNPYLNPNPNTVERTLGVQRSESTRAYQSPLVSTPAEATTSAER